MYTNDYLMYAEAKRHQREDWDFAERERLAHSMPKGPRGQLLSLARVFHLAIFVGAAVRAAGALRNIHPTLGTRL